MAKQHDYGIGVSLFSLFFFDSMKFRAHMLDEQNPRGARTSARTM